MPTPSPIRYQAEQAAAAAGKIAQCSTDQKNAALAAMADELQATEAELLDCNAVDLQQAVRDDAPTTAFLDRLRLDKNRIRLMVEGLRSLIALPDPIGEVVETAKRPNGLEISRVRVPLGVVGIIYENRPNVTSDAAGICIKSGNAAFLRGSSSALRSNQCVVHALQRGLARTGLPKNTVMLVDDVRRESAIEFMQLNGLIDCLIPRGGEGLIAAIQENATVPYILDGSGNCHVYVHASADITQALSIVKNAKTQRPSVCNAAESLLVDASIAENFLRQLQTALPNVTLYGDDRTRRVLPNVAPVDDALFAREFLGLEMSVGVVDGVEHAISHIRRFSTGHTEAILAENTDVIDAFVRGVDAAAIVVNASTRFVDGGELGLGAEIGISTQKLHCRGPMGLRELTTLKYVVRGNGHTRES